MPTATAPDKKLPALAPLTSTVRPLPVTCLPLRLPCFAIENIGHRSGLATLDRAQLSFAVSLPFPRLPVTCHPSPSHALLRSRSPVPSCGCDGGRGGLRCWGGHGPPASSTGIILEPHARCADDIEYLIFEVCKFCARGPVCKTLTHPCWTGGWSNSPSPALLRNQKHWPPFRPSLRSAGNAKYK